MKKYYLDAIWQLLTQIEDDKLLNVLYDLTSEAWCKDRSRAIRHREKSALV